ADSGRSYRSHICSSLLDALYLKLDLIAAFEREDFTRLVGRCDLDAHTLKDLPHHANLLRVGLRESPGSRPKRVLEPDANMSPHRSRHCGNAHLRGPGT